MNVWILDSESGITLLYKPYMDLALDEDLISGLLAALNQFTTYEFQQGIESIEMGGLRWSYLEDKEYLDAFDKMKLQLGEFKKNVEEFEDNFTEAIDNAHSD